jgi:hypothetical protein
MRKCPSARNEDLMFTYRERLSQNLNQLTGALIPKMAYVLSRSQFPFEEIIFRDVFAAGLIRRSNNYEIGSIVPSLARSGYRNFDVISQMCNDYALSASRDVSKHLG